MRRAVVAGVLLLAACRPNPSDPTAPVVETPEVEAPVEEPEVLEWEDLTPAESAYIWARERHADWGSIELAEDQSEMQDQYVAFRSGVADVFELYQEVFAFDEEHWTACALYMQGRVYHDAARVLDELRESDLYKLLEMYSAEHAETVESLLEGYLDSALAQWEYGQTNVDLTGSQLECALRIRADVACAQERSAEDLRTRVGCVEDDDPYRYPVPEGERP